MTHTDIEHFTVISTLWALKTSEAEILLYKYWFSRYKVARKSGMHWITPNITWTLNSQKYSLNI